MGIRERPDRGSPTIEKIIENMGGPKQSGSIFLDGLLNQCKHIDKESHKALPAICKAKPTISDSVFTNFGFEEVQKALPEKNFVQINADITKAGSRSILQQRTYET